MTKPNFTINGKGVTKKQYETIIDRMPNPIVNETILSGFILKGKALAEEFELDYDRMQDVDFANLFLVHFFCEKHDFDIVKRYFSPQDNDNN